MVLLVLGLYYQYFAVLGLPPSRSYYYGGWTAGDAPYTALLRWLFLPPLDDTVRFANGAPKLPKAWNEPTIIYADFLLAVAVSLQLRVVLRMRQNSVHFWDYVAVESPSHSAPRRIKRFLILALPWFSDFFMLLASLSRNDLICIAYLLIAFERLIHYRRLVTDRVYGLKMWYWQFWAIMITLFIRFVFILPAGEWEKVCV